jgi:hypothetical protein
MANGFAVGLVGGGDVGVTRMPGGGMALHLDAAQIASVTGLRPEALTRLLSEHASMRGLFFQVNRLGGALQPALWPSRMDEFLALLDRLKLRQELSASDYLPDRWRPLDPATAERLALQERLTAPLDYSPPPAKPAYCIETTVQDLADAAANGPKSPAPAPPPLPPIVQALMTYGQDPKRTDDDIVNQVAAVPELAGTSKDILQRALAGLRASGMLPEVANND